VKADFGLNCLVQAKNFQPVTLCIVNLTLKAVWVCIARDLHLVCQSSQALSLLL